MSRHKHYKDNVEVKRNHVKEGIKQEYKSYTMWKYKQAAHEYISENKTKKTSTFVETFWKVKN